MGDITVNGSSIGNALNALLTCNDIQAGDAPSYELCKTIYEYHPLGAKIVEAPIEAAQSQSRKIVVAGAPDRVRDAFLGQWESDGIDGHIANTGATARIYGIASLAVLDEGNDPTVPLDFDKLWKARIGFNVLDPLNTAGSLVLDQNPNSIDFQKHAGIAVAGKAYARNRSVTILNEKPIYISYTASAFGFSGRSVYQRILLPLKSFIQTMVTDDMVSKKAGLIVAFIKTAGSIVDELMAKIAGLKRSLLKMAVVDNVLSVGPDDKIESIDLKNLEGPAGQARGNILKNIATGAKMPAVMVENETLTEGFGEGTEDAKIIARFVDGVRKWLNPLYAFADPIVRRRAWNPDFIKIMKAEFPDDYAGRTDDEIFYAWEAGFSATWPNLLEEPDSEKIKVEDTKFKAMLAAVEIIAPMLDPENKTALIEWAIDNFNENKLLFGSPLILDPDLLSAWTDKATEIGTEADEPGEGGGVKEKLDSIGPLKGRSFYEDAVARLTERSVNRKVA